MDLFWFKRNELDPFEQITVVFEPDVRFEIVSWSEEGFPDARGAVGFAKKSLAPSGPSSHDQCSPIITQFKNDETAHPQCHSTTTAHRKTQNCPILRLSLFQQTQKHRAIAQHTPDSIPKTHSTYATSHLPTFRQYALAYKAIHYNSSHLFNYG